MGYRGDEEQDWRREREREEEEQEQEGRGRYPQGEDWFVLHHSRRVVQTEAGEMRIVRSPGGRLLDRQLHIGFITMEPKSLFVPQYIDSSLIIFIHRGTCTLIRHLPYFTYLQTTNWKKKVVDIYISPF